MSGGKTKTETRQDNSIDAFSRGLITEDRRNVRSLQAENPFQSYQGERVAGLNETQTGAQADFLAGQDAGTGLMSEAAEAARAAGGYQPQQVETQSFADADLSGYMNPHLSAVRDATMKEIGRNRDLSLNDMNAQATRAGAFGGSRHGVAEAETRRGYADVEARTLAQLNSDAFNSAADLFNQDANRGLQADTTNANLSMQGAELGLRSAGLMGELGGQMDASNRANAGMASFFGGQQQAVDQANLDAQYQDFLRQDQDTQRRIATELSMMGMAPIITDSTGTQTTRTNPGLMGWAGMGLQGASLFMGGGGGGGGGGN